MAALPRTSKGLKANVRPKVDDVLTYFGEDTITHGWGPNTVPDHNNLRCYDFMVPTIEAGNRVATYLISHQERLGINGIIWNRRVFRLGGTYTGGPYGKWGTYKGSSPHTDHVHVEFNDQPIRNVTGGTYSPAPVKEKDEDMAEVTITGMSDAVANKLGAAIAKYIVAQARSEHLIVHAALESVSDKAAGKITTAVANAVV